MSSSIRRRSRRGSVISNASGRPYLGRLIDGTLLSLACAAALTAFLHAVLPTHWLPFVLVGRAQRWGAGRLAAVTALAAGGHALMTGMVGMAVAFMGYEIAERLEPAERFGGFVLIAFGVVYAVFDIRHLGHRRMHHVHDGEIHDAHHHRPAIVEGAAIGSLILALSVSPCVALTPVFFSAGAIGLAAAGFVAGVNAAVTVALVPLMAVLASSGLRRLPLERLERYERTMVGVLLVAIGVAVLLLPHEHHG